MPYKPDIEDIIKEKDKRKNETFSELRKMQREWDDLYELKFDTGIKPPYHEVHLARARNNVDVGVDHLVSDNPTVTVDPRNTLKKSKEQADRIEKYLQGRADTQISNIRESAKDIMIMGEFFTKIVIDIDSLAELNVPVKDMYNFDKEKYEELLQEYDSSTIDYFPIKILTPHPMNVYWHPYEHEGRPWDVFEIYQRDVLEMAEHWPNFMGISQAHTGDMGEWCEYWHRECRCFMFEESPVFKGKAELNGYGFVPYRHGLSGYGYRAAKFEPHKIVKSILFAAKDEIVEESRIVSMLDSQVKMFSHPMAYKVGKWDASEIVIGPAQIIELPDGKKYGEDFEIIKGQEPSQTTYQLVSMLGSFLEQSQPGVLRGQAISASAPASANFGMANKGALKFGYPLISLQYVYAKTLEDELRLIETVINKPLGVMSTMGGHNIETIKPEDINGYYRCNLTLQSKDPTFTLNRAMEGFKLWQGGAIDFDDFQQKYLNNPNATEMRTKILMDKILANPVVEQALAQELIKELGIQLPQPQGTGGGQNTAPPVATTSAMEIQANMMRGDNTNGQQMGHVPENPQRVEGRIERAGGTNPLNSLPGMGT